MEVAAAGAINKRIEAMKTRIKILLIITMVLSLVLAAPGISKAGVMENAFNASYVKARIFHAKYIWPYTANAMTKNWDRTVWLDGELHENPAGLVPKGVKMGVEEAGGKLTTAKNVVVHAGTGDTNGLKKDVVGTAAGAALAAPFVGTVLAPFIDAAAEEYPPILQNYVKEITDAESVYYMERDKAWGEYLDDVDGINRAYDEALATIMAEYKRRGGNVWSSVANPELFKLIREAIVDAKERRDQAIADAMKEFERKQKEAWREFDHAFSEACENVEAPGRAERIEEGSKVIKGVGSIIAGTEESHEPPKGEDVTIKDVVDKGHLSDRGHPAGISGKDAPKHIDCAEHAEETAPIVPRGGGGAPGMPRGRGGQPVGVGNDQLAALQKSISSQVAASRGYLESELANTTDPNLQKQIKKQIDGIDNFTGRDVYKYEPPAYSFEEIERAEIKQADASNRIIRDLNDAISAAKNRFALADPSDPQAYDKAEREFYVTVMKAYNTFETERIAINTVYQHITEIEVAPVDIAALYDVVIPPGFEIQEESRTTSEDQEVNQSRESEDPKNKLLRNSSLVDRSRNHRMGILEKRSIGRREQAPTGGGGHGGGHH